MADKIKAIKIKQINGTYSEEIPISVNVQNVQWDENNHTLLDALGSVDISSSGKGNLQHQIDELDGDKISTNEFNLRLNDFLKDQISADTTDWLDDNVNPVGSAVIVDKTLTIEGAAADALAVKTELNKKANASNTYTKAEVNAAIDAKKIEVDDTLSITGTAADAKAVGDELTAVKDDLGDLTELETEDKTDLVSAINEAAQSGLSNDVKNAILAAFDKVAWSDGRGQDYYDGLEAALYPNISHDVHGWFYEFNNSLLSSGDKDFGFTGSEFYDPSGVNGKAYYHKVATEGTASTDPLGIYKIGLSDVPDLSGDFTISFWHKSITNKRGYLFRATKFDSLNRVPVIKGTMDNPYWSDNVSASADVAGSFKGVRLSYDGNNGYLYIGLSSLTQNKTIYAALIMPNSIDTRFWHHHAITRSNGVIRYFFDGGLIWHVENSDPIAFPNQVCLGNTFGTTQATATNVVQDKYGGIFDDLYIVQFAKWTSAFDPTNIVY